MFDKIYKQFTAFISAKAFPWIFPFVLFVLYCIWMPNWFYNTVGWVDGWAYTGFFMDYPGLRSAFPHHPAGDLLSLLFPGVLFYQVFTPFWANFLFKLCRFVLIGGMFFQFLKQQTGLRGACLGVLLLLTAFPFIEAIRTDYTDGMTVFYLVGALFCFSSAYVRDTYKYVYLFLGGLFFAGSVTTTLLSLTLGVPFALFIIMQQYYADKKLTSIVLSGLVVAGGFFAAIAILAFLHHLLGFDWLFFKATLAKASAFLGQVRTSFSLWQSIIQPGPLWFFLFFGFSVLAGLALCYPAKRFNKSAGISLLMFATALLIYVFLQVCKNQETISNIYYINHLLPFVVFAVAAVVSPILEGLNNKQMAVWAIVCVYVALLPIVVFPAYFPAPVSWQKWCVFFIPVLAGVVVVWKAKNSWLLVFFLLVWGSANYCPRWVLEAYNQHLYLGKPLCSAELLNATAAWVETVKANDPARKYYLWYHSGNNWLFRHMAASSHLWQGRVLNEEMPILNGKIIGGVPGNIENISQIMLLAENEQKLREAQQVLRQVQNKNFICEKMYEAYSSNRFAIWVSQCQSM